MTLVLSEHLIELISEFVRSTVNPIKEQPINVVAVYLERLFNDGQKEIKNYTKNNDFQSAAGLGRLLSRLLKEISLLVMGKGSFGLLQSYASSWKGYSDSILFNAVSDYMDDAKQSEKQGDYERSTQYMNMSKDLEYRITKGITVKEINDDIEDFLRSKTFQGTYAAQVLKFENRKKETQKVIDPVRIKLKNDSCPSDKSSGRYNWSVYLDTENSIMKEVESVTYTLHPTFANPIRKIIDPSGDFRLKSNGWGEFQIKADIALKNGDVITKYHWLQLSSTPSGGIASTQVTTTETLLPLKEPSIIGESMRWYHVRILLNIDGSNKIEELVMFDMSESELRRSIIFPYNRGEKFLFSERFVDPSYIVGIRIIGTYSRAREITSARTITFETLRGIGENLTYNFVTSPPGRIVEKLSDEQETVQSKKVFVVHGHDEQSKNELASFLYKLGLKPVILYEQPTAGKTIVEKLEDTTRDTGYAFILLTPDDVGGIMEQRLKPRARQNVVLELGYLAGKLGRNKVCALSKRDVEIPSDVLGILYLQYEESIIERQHDIVQELVRAGYMINK